MKLLRDIEQPVWDLSLKGIIYALYLETDETLKYGGQTVRRARERLNGHLGNAGRLIRGSRGRGLALPVNYWIVKHGAENVRMVILEVVGDDPEKLNEAEEKWIDWLGTYHDPRGLNLRPGGASTSGWNLPDSTKDKISQAHTGRKHDLSDEMKQKKREWMNQVREAHGNPTQRLTAEEVLQIKRRIFQGDPVPEIAGSYGVTEANIYSISRGVTWSEVEWPIGPVPRDRYKPTRVGDKANNRTLNSKDVKRIKERIWAGEFPQDIAKDYDVDHSAIRAIEKGETWSSVPDPEGVRVQRDSRKRANDRIRGQKRDPGWFEEHSRTYRTMQLDKAPFRIRDIRRVRSLRYEMGMQYQEIAQGIGKGLTALSVGKICRGERWGWVE